MKMKKTISYVFENKILKKLVLSKSVDRDILRMTGRLIEIKGEVYLALESFSLAEALRADIFQCSFATTKNILAASDFPPWI